MEILIVDLETTGWLKAGGQIVEIGIVELNTKTGEKTMLFDSVINPNQDAETIEKSWIVQKGYMTAKEILEGVQLSDVRDVVQSILNNHPDGITAFNNKFDFDYLEANGFELKYKLPCPMLASTAICKLPNRNGWKGYKWPNVQEAYNHFFPGNEYNEIHRGGDDAWHESDIVMKLIELNKLF
jgi:DNA polymerase III epsilon subunit-like protein